MDRLNIRLLPEAGVYARSKAFIENHFQGNCHFAFTFFHQLDGDIPSMMCAFFGFSLSMMETMSVMLTSTSERELFVRGAEVGGMVLSVSKILQ